PLAGSLSDIEPRLIAEIHHSGRAIHIKRSGRVNRFSRERPDIPADVHTGSNERISAIGNPYVGIDVHAGSKCWKRSRAADIDGAAVGGGKRKTIVAAGPAKYIQIGRSRTCAQKPQGLLVINAC